MQSTRVKRLALTLLLACSSGPATLALQAGDVEPWPEGVAVVETVSVIETPGEAGTGPDREATVFVLDGSGAGAVDEQLAGVVVDHLRERGWALSATFDAFPSFVGSHTAHSAIVIVGTLSALLDAAAPLNAVGAAEIKARQLDGDGWVVAEFVASGE